MKIKTVFPLFLTGVLLLASCGWDDDTSELYSVIVHYDTNAGTASTDKATARSGENITLSATPNAGYNFIEWRVDGGGITIPYKDANVAEFTMPAANVTVTAVFSGDKGNLNIVITAAGALIETNYTTGSWRTLQNALNAAKAVAGNSGATAAQISTAIANLNAAMNALQVRASKNDLNGAITNARALNSANYTPDSWNALQQALASAQAVADNANATTAEISAALDSLQTAVSNLKPAADKSGLNAAISAAGALSEANYTPESWAALQSALSNAQTVAGDANASGTQVSDALTQLQTALNGLQIKTVAADKSALNARITQATGLKQADYTADTWSTLQSNLASAQAVANNASASQVQVDAADSALARAIANLQHVTVSADKTQLNAFIADAEKLNQADYTANSWSTFQNALSAAKTVSANASATQAQVTTAYNDLETAVQGLQANTSSGLTRDLVNQLTDLLGTLPSESVIASNPLLISVVSPVATLADQVRDQLVGLLGNTVDPTVEALNTRLNGILRAVNLNNLI